MTLTLAKGSATLDTSRFPIVMLSERGVLRDAERVEVVEALLDVLADHGRHAVVLDLYRASSLTEAQRMYVGEQLGMYAREIRKKWAALAIVVKDQPGKSSLAAFWTKVAPVPAQAFNALDEAIAWARAQSAGADEGRPSMPRVSKVE